MNDQFSQAEIKLFIHSNASAYPILLVTLHIKTYIGL